MTKSIYKSLEGEAEVMALYERRMSLLPIPCERRMVETRFGPTQVAIAGPTEAPPLVTLPGVHAPAPFNLNFWISLTDEYRLYSPDAVGQPGGSAQTRMDPRGNHYAKWLIDLLDGLGLDRTPMVGVSFGAGVLLDTAAVSPERISRAVLVVPAGLADGPLWPVFFEFFLPATLYRLFPTRDRLVRTFRPLMTEIPEELLEFFGLFFRHVRWSALGPRPPGPFPREALKRFYAPTLVFLAKNDFFVPFDRASAAAREILPNLVAVEALEGAHIPTKKTQESIADRVRKFLRETA